MVEIREFREEDAEAVAKIVHEAFRTFLEPKLGDAFEHLFPHRPPEYWAKNSNHRDAYGEMKSFTATEDGKVVGYVQVTATPCGLGSLNIVAIDPGSFAKGLGSLLMSAAESFWHEKSQRKISTCVSAHNLKALQYYMKHDFRPEGVRRDHFFVGVDEIMLGRFL